MKNQNIKLILLTTLIASTLTMMPPSWANVSSTRHPAKTIVQDEPIHIEADRVTFMQDSGKIIYQGHVVVKTGDKTLLANEVTVKRDLNQKIQSIVATGHPAKFSTPMQDSTELLHAHAQNINYNPGMSLLVLTGKAKLKHQQDTFEGPILRYTLNEQKIEAVTSNNQRPKMVIMPKKGDS